MLHSVASQNARTFRRNLVRAYSVCNPTPATGIAEAVKNAFAATAALCVLRNTGTGGMIRPRYIRLVNTVAPASATAMHCRMVMDFGATRFSSGGSSLTPICRDGSLSVASAATFKIGAVVTTAATSSKRDISQSSPSLVIPVVGDEIFLCFGIQDMAEAAASNLGGTTARRLVTNVGPVVIPPNAELIVHTYYPSNAATPASWEVESLWQESGR